MAHASRRALAEVCICAAPTFATAHGDHCAAVAASVADAGFADNVAVTYTDSHAVITSDTDPDHDMMTGITGTNERVPVPAECAAPIILRGLARRRSPGMLHSGSR